jgi:hypothetical protein
MAKTSAEIINLLRNTATAIAQTSDYQWGHMGACNCGHLAQQITHLNKDEIHRRAMQSHGDWSEQLNDYCPASGLPLDDLISEMIAIGFDTSDLKHLERLSDPSILNTLPFNEKFLIHNRKADVVAYLEAWANKIEADLLESIKLDDLTTAHQITELPIKEI